jgi:hypothetical protein
MPMASSNTCGQCQVTRSIKVLDAMALTSNQLRFSVLGIYTVTSQKDKGIFKATFVQQHDFALLA